MCQKTKVFVLAKTSGFPDAAAAADAASAAAAADGRTLRSQPDPSPNAPRDQIRLKERLFRQGTSLAFLSVLKDAPPESKHLEKLKPEMRMTSFWPA